MVAVASARVDEAAVKAEYTADAVATDPLNNTHHLVFALGQVLCMDSNENGHRGATRHLYCQLVRSFWIRLIAAAWFARQ